MFGLQSSSDLFKLCQLQLWQRKLDVIKSIVTWGVGEWDT